MTRETGIIKEDLGTLQDIIKKNKKIVQAILFGSRAKGTQSAGSDVDIALKGNNLKLDDILNIQIELENVDFPYKTDLVIYDRITERTLKEHIDRIGIVLFSREL